MDGSFRLPATDGSGRDRTALRRALELFAQAGYVIEQGVLRNRTGEALTFEILLQSRAQERIALNYVAALKRAGIAASIRPVDTTQIEQRRKTFDFDMTPFFWAGSLSPGNEQSFRWSSQAAATEGTFNMPGVRSGAVDAMIQALLAAETPEAFVAAVRALDRVLISGFYVLPLFHRPAEWVAHWERIAHPKIAPLIGYALETWWAIDTGAKP
jgi:peptide/nickel transport system substrate-binding protein